MSVSGFKSIASEIALDVKPLTLLAGTNSSGKSSFIQPLLLLKQTLEAPYDPGPSQFLINGSNVKFTLYEQIFSKGCHEISFKIFMPHLCWKTTIRLLKEIFIDISPYDQKTREIIGKIIHVPGLRGNPERSYSITGTGPTFPGTFEHYTASIIANWNEKDSNKIEQLCEQISRLGLTSKISAKRLNDAEIEVKVARLPQNGRSKPDMVNIADIGFGVSQTLPVLTALLVAESGQLVYLEQPEIHLHPKAQHLLAKVLIDAANRGVKVVAETHSALLLLGVQTLIAQEKIAPDNVAFYWFQRDKNGQTKTTTAKIDENGAFGDLPIDFAEVEMDADEEYIKAASKKVFS
ncbi:MAG: AAA family ATPase [Planctomycetaceae bacterium]|nr:AAA family ATPase [Planctomycetaceae bacterium]